MPLPAVTLGTAAALEAAALLKAGADIYTAGGAEYIKSGTSVGIIPLVGRELARQSCRRYADRPDQVSATAAVNYEKACRPYLDDIGYGRPPSLEPPFEGGRCNARYTVTADRYNLATGALAQSNQILITQFQGPLTYETVPGNPPAGGCTTGTFVQGRNIVSATGQRVSIGGGGCSSFHPQFRNIRVTRADGLPDNCGSPPPDVVEPGPPPTRGPKIEPIIIVPIVNIDADLEINIDGTIDIDIGTGPITINPFGDDDGETPPGGGGEDAPGAPEPGPELPGGNGGFGGDDAFGAPPVGKRWVGACIRIVATPPGHGVIPQSIPDDVFPSVVGNIRLVGAPGGSRLVDTPLRITAKHVCVWEPVRGFNPTGVSVDLLPGYGYTYRPYAVPEDN